MTNAVLLRNVPLVMRDVSSGGCSVQSHTPLHVGMVGWLEVDFEGERRFEWFRIARVHTANEGVCLAGVEFLPLAVAGADSIRSAIGRLRPSVDLNGSEHVAEEPQDALGGGGDGAGEDDAASTATSRARKIVNFFRRRP